MQRPNAALYRVLHGHNWSQTDALLANSFDRLGQLAGVIIAVNGGKARKLDPHPRPKPLTPGGATESRTRGEALPIADVLAWAAESEGTSDG